MEKRGKIVVLVVVLALVFLATQLKADDVPVQLEVNYNNTPPTLLQDIPDQYLAINVPKIDSFDLDDYFVDNETLSYSVNYTGDQNVTVTINSENLVSFYPDLDYRGSINITFIADDGFTTSESNIVQIFVQNDTNPPKWSNPLMIHTGTIIYQNSYVNFSVDWTDDFGLDNFVFMINQGTGWQSYAAESMTGLQNTSRYRVKISSSGGIAYWKIGAYDLAGNYNETDPQNFTVQSTPEPPEGDDESDSSGDREQRFGEGFAPAPEPGAEDDVTGFTVSPESFNVKVKQDSSVTVSLKITNIGTQTLAFSVIIRGIEVLGKTISENEFNISAGASKTINVMFEASNETPIDIYYGKIKVESSEGEVKDVPIAVTVRAAITDLDLDLKVLEEYKQVRPEEPVRANITIENLAEIDTKTVRLYYSLTDFVGNILDSKTEDFELSQKQITLEKELIPPRNAPPGEYIFFARATSQDDTTIDSDTFFLGSRFTVWGFIKTNLLLFLIIIASIIVAILMVKHHRNQERLRLLNLYIMITNLKKLLKEGDLEKAIKLYVRIKSTYGQPVSRSALKDKDSLKKEMEKLTEKLHSPEAIKVKKEAEEKQKEREGKEGSKEEGKKEESKEGEDKKEEAKPKEESEEKKEAKPQQSQPEQKQENKPAPGPKEKPAPEKEKPKQPAPSPQTQPAPPKTEKKPAEKPAPIKKETESEPTSPKPKSPPETKPKNKQEPKEKQPEKEEAQKKEEKNEKKI